MAAPRKSHPTKESFNDVLSLFKPGSKFSKAELTAAINTFITAWSKKYYKKEYVVIFGTRLKISVGPTIPREVVIDQDLTPFCLDEQITKNQTEPANQTKLPPKQAPFLRAVYSKNIVQGDCTSPVFYTKEDRNYNAVFHHQTNKLIYADRGYCFVKPKQLVVYGDKFFNLRTLQFQPVESRDVGCEVGHTIYVVIRPIKYCSVSASFAGLGYIANITVPIV